MSVKHNPPFGTVLRHLVDAWHASLAEATWNSDNPNTRIIGEFTVMNEEPRPWKWPRQIFREHMGLPLIERVDGAAAAEALRSAPKTLDHYCDLLAEQLRRDAPANVRNAPRPDNKTAVENIVLALFFCRYDATRSINWNCNRVAEALKINRGAVWRIFKSRGYLLREPLVCRALLVVMEFIEANLPGASVRNRAPVSKLSANKNLPHA